MIPRLLLFFVLFCLAVAAKQNCEQQRLQAAPPVDKKYEDVGWYTKVMSIIMRGLIGEIRAETATVMGKIPGDPKNVHKHMMEIIKYQPAITTILAILITISVCLLIATVIVFIVRWCKPDKEGLTPNKCQMTCTLIAFLIGCVVCALGAFVLFLTIQGAKNGINDLGANLNSTSGQISSFVEGYETMMTCQMKNQDADLDQLLKAQDVDLNTQATRITNFIEQTEVDGKELEGVSQPGFKTELEKMKQALGVLYESVNKMKGEMGAVTASAGKAFKEKYAHLVNTVKQVKQGFKKMESQLLAVMADNNYYAGGISAAVQYSFLIPIILCGFMAFGFVVLFIRFVSNCGKENQEQKRGCLSVVVGNMMAITGYAAMLVGALMFAVAAGTFVIAFASMFLCIGFFDDPDLLVFGAFSTLNQKIENFTLHEAFIRCKNDYPFFDAIDGDKQLATDILAAIYKKIGETDFGEQFREFNVPAAMFSGLAQLKKQAVSLSHNQKKALARYAKHLYLIDARAWRDEQMLLMDEQLEIALQNLANEAADKLKEVLDMSPQCEEMMKIWDNAGKFICNSVSMPAQGAWMACVICGIGACTVFHWMFKSTRYLKNFDNTKEPKNKQKKSRKSGPTKSQ